MVDRTVTQEAILAEETTFKVRRSDETNYAILNDIIDDTVQFTPEGNEPKKFEAISGVTLEVPGKIRTLTATFPVWLTTNELELLIAMFGDPSTAGTLPYVHTFNLETIGQDIDFVITGPRYGSSTEQAELTGTSATIKMSSLDIEKGGLWKLMCEITVSAANLNLDISSDTDLTSL